jgi:hypothetical protein
MEPNSIGAYFWFESTSSDGDSRRPDDCHHLSVRYVYQTTRTSLVDSVEIEYLMLLSLLLDSSALPLSPALLRPTPDGEGSEFIVRLGPRRKKVGP